MDIDTAIKLISFFDRIWAFARIGYQPDPGIVSLREEGILNIFEPFIIWPFSGEFLRRHGMEPVNF